MHCQLSEWTENFFYYDVIILKQTTFLVFLPLIFFLNSCIYAEVKKQSTDASKGQQIIFDYTSHVRERGIAFKYFSLILPSFHGSRDINTDNVENHNIGIATYDVDNDGQEEILVYLKNSGYCGSAGCVFQIIKMLDHNYKEFIPNNISVQEKIKVLDNKYMNHHDVLFYNRFGNPTSIWKWNGSRYNISKSLTTEH